MSILLALLTACFWLNVLAVLGYALSVIWIIALVMLAVQALATVYTKLSDRRDSWKRCWRYNEYYQPHAFITYVVIVIVGFIAYNMPCN